MKLPGHNSNSCNNDNSSNNNTSNSRTQAQLGARAEVEARGVVKAVKGARKLPWKQTLYSSHLSLLSGA